MQLTTTTAAFLATPTRLRSDDWGARVTLGTSLRAPVRGDRVRVRSHSGKEWDACVEKIVWTGSDHAAGGDVWICAVSRAPALDQTRRDPASRPAPARRSAGAWLVVATDVETGTVKRMELDTEAQARSYAEALTEDGDGSVRYEVRSA